MRRCERLESGVRWESLTLSSAWLLANSLFMQFPRLQELDPVGLGPSRDPQRRYASEIRNE